MSVKPKPRPAAFTLLQRTNISCAGNILPSCAPTTVKSTGRTLMTGEQQSKLFNERNEVLAA